jgi:hypothetical protein
VAFIELAILLLPLLRIDPRLAESEAHNSKGTQLAKPPASGKSIDVVVE